MKIKHNEKTGEVVIKFSWLDIFKLIKNRKISANKLLFRDMISFFAKYLAKNIQNKLYE